MEEKNKIAKVATAAFLAAAVFFAVVYQVAGNNQNGGNIANSSLLAEISLAGNQISEIKNQLAEDQPPTATPKKSTAKKTKANSAKAVANLSVLKTETASQTNATASARNTALIAEATNSSLKKETAPPPDPCDFDAPGNPAHTPIIFNEIAWMGTTANYQNEWFELKNISNTTVPLANWQILDERGNVAIVFGANDTLPLGGFYLLERGSDDSTPARPVK